MATQTIDETAIGSPKAIQYWTEHFRSALVPLFELTGGYTSDDIQQHMAFIREHVAPVIGPVPSAPFGRFNKAFCPSTMEVSVNLTTNGKPNVRYWINPLKPLDAATSLAPGAPEHARDVLRAVAKAAGPNTDMRWMDCLLDYMTPSPEGLQGIRDRQAASNGPVWPFMQFGFDFRGSDKIMRSYFPCIPKGGKGRTEICLDAINSLQPLGEGLKPVVNLITE